MKLFSFLHEKNKWDILASVDRGKNALSYRKSTLLLCCGLNGQPHKLEEGGSAWNQHESCRETMTPPLWLHSSPALPPATEGTHTHTQRAVPRELVTTRVPPRRAQAEATSCMCPWPHACTCLFCRLLPKAHLSVISRDSTAVVMLTPAVSPGGIWVAGPSQHPLQPR